MIVSADDPTPTIVGLLVLGDSPRDDVPNAWIQFLRIDGPDLSDDVIDAEEIDGNLAEMLRATRRETESMYPYAGGSDIGGYGTAHRILSAGGASANRTQRGHAPYL